MIPQGGSLTNVTVREVQQPSLTWGVDFTTGRITGKVDGLAAVRQAVLKALQTDRFWHAVYTFNYGHELGTLSGRSPIYVQSEAARMISEALLQDDRITSVDDVQAVVQGDEMTVSFTVVTDFGSFREELNRGV
ncbi:Protein of unknown function [Paenibacillus algorifonticola]|uniref:DUF2634 domain-containing protein n=1 Tax=Paenibacillus algorifonticola TaxID=684063 RepID=A0A1I2H3G7_9BACL|nr:DUF2634 domain-containing protein [Paenibacillus algorifonticola]SFF23231.1 Protein of unknown function [Paenibacillus algorifonticola]